MAECTEASVDSSVNGLGVLPRDMSDTYKALLSDDDSDHNITTAPLSLNAPARSFDDSIQDSLTDSSISSNTYTQLGFPASDTRGGFPGTIDMSDKNVDGNGTDATAQNEAPDSAAKRLDWSSNSCYTPLSEDRRAIALDTVYEIENVVSDDSTAATGKSSTPLAPLLPGRISTENNLVSPAIMSDLDVSVETVETSNIDGKKVEGKEGKGDDDSAIELLNSVHSTGSRRNQATPSNTSQDDEITKLASPMWVSGVPPFGPAVDGKTDSLLIGRFHIDEGDPMHVSSEEALLGAYDIQTKPATRVVLKLMRDPGQVLAELESRRGIDSSFVVPVMEVFMDENGPDIAYNGPIKVEQRKGLEKELCSSLASHIDYASGSVEDTTSCPTFGHVLVLEFYNRTLEDVLAHDIVDLPLARKIIKDVVVGLILLHTEMISHGDIKPRSIVRVGTSWKLSDLQSSCQVGKSICNAKKSNWGYAPPEVAVALFDSNQPHSFFADAAYDLWSLGCILYHLVFASSLWNVDKFGKISEEDLKKLAKWSPQSFLRRALNCLPSEQYTHDQKAAIHLVSKLLAPTPENRHSNFEFGIVSVHQHEFLAGKPLERGSIECFEARQKLVQKSEKEHGHYLKVMRALSLEEQWELRRIRDVLLLGMFEPTEVHIPTSFVILKEKLSSSERVQERLEEGMKWVNRFEILEPSVKGALDGDISSIGHFWGKIMGMFQGDYMYFYFIDELTGEVVRGDDTNDQYPIEIKTWSDLVPKMLPLMHLTMRAMALYYGVAGIARMFGSPSTTLPEGLRSSAQEKINGLKSERSSASPFGVIAHDVDNLTAYKELFLKSKDNTRCKSLRELVRFLEKKIGPDDTFAGLNRYPDEHGTAIWTMLRDAEGVKTAIKRRSDERLQEAVCQWTGSRQDEVDTVKRDLDMEQKKVTWLEEALNNTKTEMVKSKRTVESLKNKVAELTASLDDAKQQLEQASRDVEDEQSLTKKSEKSGAFKRKKKNWQG